MRIFITGATGVIGRRALPALLGSGHTVTAAVRSTEKGRTVQRAGATAVQLDLFDAEVVRRALTGHDAVINLMTHVPHSTWRMLMRGAWRENDRIRREGSRILADAAIAADASRFIQESFGLI